MYIIIVGCGKLGGKLARELADEGNDICIVDRDSNKLNGLGSGFNGQRITGIEFDSDKLKEAGIESADVLLAVTPDDNINITVSLIAEKIYNVKKIIARVNDPGKKYIYNTLEIEVIDPVQYEIEVLQSKLVMKNVEVISFLDNEYEIIEVFVNKQKEVLVGDIENRYSCLISGLVKNSEVRLPNKTDRIKSGDRIICTVQKKNKQALINLFNKEILL
ncbi:potassium channel family protein [Anaerosacchariphilus polymeriproducens]|uniref:RCK N-terminal domain-containing protein n=1 Tax=Anaerosacchariphilus polymeriproducens TaxID=1812858 RepID=A0A371AYU6_9FIRM|nr:NAD-binding protein [Anaerosacchariphilus polymeriproducens]RDU24731.1 hypothetical protein DWV06_04485 [Anaerosacchariphilus polymeriproducens]